MTKPQTTEKYEINDTYRYKGRFYENDENFSTEELYQAFRKRFLEELIEHQAFDDATTQTLAREFI